MFGMSSSARILRTLRVTTGPRGLPSAVQCRSLGTDDGRRLYDTGIMVTNSLTKKKEPLRTHTEGILTWYQCGPTVYDSAHIGHACTYVWFDIIRRILSDHAGLVVLQAQGVTDVDDKIIARAAATDQDPFDLARAVEQEFAEQMDRLNVQAPLLTLRVTEHVSEIVGFIEGIERHNHAYATPLGVYFDTDAFGADPRFTYGKLHPKRQRNTEGYATEDAEGAGKRKPADFALWKAAKTGEPGWASPWGDGRPGWHIECSAMASRVFGSTLDLHTGGKDLAFPHHENEMAQSESFHGVAQWGQTYLHSGHVMLKGSKMSKSVGNIVRVDDLLSQHTADEFRMLCLLTRYRDSFNYDDDVFARAVHATGRFHDFSERCRLVVSRAAGIYAVYGDEERALVAAVSDTKAACARHFVDDFDTPSAMAALLRLVALTNQYIERNQAGGTVSSAAVVEAARCVESTLRLVGLSGPDFTQSGLTRWSNPGTTSSRPHHTPDSASSHADAIDALVQFRGTVRELALATIKGATKGSSEHTLAVETLQQCDLVRDRLAAVEPKRYVVRDLSSGSTWQIK
eukprot:m.236171 g.236171  ORF g.236171 m.236171 type:complete len:571 (-) comp26174_c0_seq1:66-1778(-)